MYMIKQQIGKSITRKQIVDLYGLKIYNECKNLNSLEDAHNYILSSGYRIMFVEALVDHFSIDYITEIVFLDKHYEYLPEIVITESLLRAYFSIILFNNYNNTFSSENVDNIRDAAKLLTKYKVRTLIE